jgi:hypothetical protein
MKRKCTGRQQEDLLQRIGEFLTERDNQYIPRFGTEEGRAEFLERGRDFALQFDPDSVELLYDEDGGLRKIRDSLNLFGFYMKKQFELPSGMIQSGNKVKLVWNTLNQDGQNGQQIWRDALERYKQLFKEATKDPGLIFSHKLMFY